MEVLRELRRRGVRTRALSRRPERAPQLRELADEVVAADAMRPETLGPALVGVDRVFSCVGACVIPCPSYGRRTFTQLDTPANCNLVDAAVSADVRKFVYVGVFGHRKLPNADFIRGHELVVEELRRSGLNYAVVRPTGFFSAMEEILLVASRGLLPEFGGGTPRTNPISEIDLARFCVDAFDSVPGFEADIGGPDALERREISGLALAALKREARHVKVPVGALKLASLAYRPFNPRVSHLFDFIADILVDDFVAPPYGQHHIADYFRERAAELGAQKSSRIGAPSST